jgi:hypothetical protein
MRIKGWRVGALIPLCALAAFPAGAEWVNLMNGKNLDGWEVVGDNGWTVMSDGTLLAQRAEKLPDQHQSWLYTKKEYGEFDLQVDYWVRLGGNSGVSIRDTSRGRYAVSPNWDLARTPSKIGYEIQISNAFKGKPHFPSGSVYLLDEARDGVQKPNDWNAMEIRSRNDGIQVFLNGTLVSKHPGVPARPKIGPIGLQLYEIGIVMFRNMRIRDLAAHQ